MIPKNIDTPLKNEMNIDEMPTPETDAHTLRATDIEGGGDFNAVHIQVAKDLERRLTIEKNRANEMGKLAHANACEAMEYRRLLTVARVALDTLARLGNGPNFGHSDGNIIAHHALELTAPKP